MSERDGTATDPLPVPLRWLFGDRRGLAVFLGAVAALAITWRVGFFITDSTTVANTMANVAEGRLTVSESPYSLTLGSQPGLHRVGDQFYGRNYGQVFLAVPVLMVLRGATVFADLRLVLLGGWTLTLVAFVGQLAAVYDRPRIRTVGSAVGLVLFVVGVVVARPLDASRDALLALQITGILAGAVAALAIYRLGTLFHGPRVGVVAGAGLALASPMTFWAPIPKRHVLGIATVSVALFLFAVGRSDGRRALAARAGAYGVVGAYASVHAFESAFLFAVLVPVDLLTAPSNRPRALAAVLGALLLGLLPTLVLNGLISGNPLRPPRALADVGSSAQLPPDLGSDFGTGGGTGGGGSSGGGGGAGGGAAGGSGLFGGLVAGLVGAVASGTDYVGVVVGYLGSAVTGGLEAAGDPGRLWHVFVRSGRIPGVNYAANGYEAVELTLVEAFPSMAGLVWLPVAGVTWVATRWSDTVDAARKVRHSPQRATDLLALGWVAVLTVVYLPLLPLHAQITVRYILPIVPLLVYGLVRLAPVREAVATAWYELTRGYLVVAVGGTLLFVAVLAPLAPAVGEAMQFHALVGLGAGVAVAAATASWPVHRNPRVVAAAVATAAGVTTAFLALTGLAYLPYGEYALGPARVLADLLPLL